MRNAIMAAASAAATVAALAAAPAAASAQAVQWAQVSAGYEFTCAVQTGHTLWCWGSGQDGELGDGSTASHDSPVRTAAGRRAQASAGAGHACAVGKDGLAWCWGDNLAGDLGDGTSGGCAPARSRSPAAATRQYLAPGTASAPSRPAGRRGAGAKLRGAAGQRQHHELRRAGPGRHRDRLDPGIRSRRVLLRSPGRPLGLVLGAGDQRPAGRRRRGLLRHPGPGLGR